jgi:predicted nucleic acid-binding protein
MLIENDMVLVYYKKKDHLKPIAEQLFSKIEQGKLGQVLIPSIFSIELYYVLRNLTGIASVRDIISHIITFPNLSVIPSTIDHQLGALFLMDNYQLSSIFDAIYASVALSNDNPDKIIISSDQVYDRVEGLQRLNPDNV